MLHSLFYRYYTIQFSKLYTVITHTHTHTHTHTATCMDGDVKLVGGASDFEGRLEVCFDHRWTTVDGYGWTDSDTKVACRQLGQSTSGIIAGYF